MYGPSATKHAPALSGPRASLINSWRASPPQAAKALAGQSGDLECPVLYESCLDTRLRRPTSTNSVDHRRGKLKGWASA